jgi:phage tail-like protein
MPKDDGSVLEKASWPQVKFSFGLDLGDGRLLHFAAITGLGVETQVTDYRGGEAASVPPRRIPGQPKFGAVTLLKGLLPSDAILWEWLEAGRRNARQPRTVLIHLCDESGAPAMTYTLAKALPVRIGRTQRSADGAEVAVESLDLAHEGFTLANA